MMIKHSFIVCIMSYHGSRLVYNKGTKMNFKAIMIIHNMIYTRSHIVTKICLKERKMKDSLYDGAHLIHLNW